MNRNLGNQVVVSPQETAKHLPRRTLNLSNIQTHELKLLKPLPSEIMPTAKAGPDPLLSYSERLRNSYRANEGGLRDGMLLLGETIKNGQAILVSCSCGSGELCHADVVKMAIEKVHDRLQIRDAAERLPVPSATIRESEQLNPRTQRAINEILSVTKTDLLLAKIDNTEGRSQNEHASFLNQHSQFTRDLYERGATAQAGRLIVPKERLSVPPTLNLTTHEHAVKKLEQILQDKAKAVELSSKLVGYGKQIAGSTADRETQMKVFNWIYRSLEGKSEFLDSPETKVKDESDQARFDRTMNEIANLANELSQFEPSEYLVSLDELTKQNGLGPANEGAENSQEGHESIEEQIVRSDLEMSTSSQPQFERIELGSIALSQMTAEMDNRELEHWFEVRLPAIDRELENGRSVSEILSGYEDNIYLASIHEPSSKHAAVTDLRFASAYIDHQLKNLESRLRHFNPRYRKYAELLETSQTRGEIIDAASNIRSENAKLGLEWDKLPDVKKAKTPPPLTSKEMQFLFTEVSPSHYTSEMTIARLAYSHAGATREMMTESLMNGEIKPSREAQKLVESLESRLERRYLNDSLGATKHFLQSLKTPNHELRYRNDFDHKDLYLKLPPPERDFIYQRAVIQKENLEARLKVNDQEVTQNNLVLDSLSNKSVNKSNVLREEIVSDLLKALESHPKINQAVLTEQTTSIVNDRIVRDEPYEPTIKETIDKLSHELAERIGEIGISRFDRDASKQFTTAQNWNNHRVSEKPFIQSR